MQSADLVAGGIAQIREVETAARAFTRWVFASGTAICYSGGVPGIGGFRRSGSEADGAAVTAGGGLAVDRRSDCEHAGRRHVKTAALAVHVARLVAERAEYGIVEFFRCGDVGCADHDVTEHSECMPRWLVESE